MTKYGNIGKMEENGNIGRWKRMEEVVKCKNMGKACDYSNNHTMYGYIHTKKVVF